MKIAQLIFIAARLGSKPRDGADFETVRQLLDDGEFGGIILFGGSIFETPMQVNTLQRFSKLPLLVSSDLERGAGQQIEGATDLPPPMAIGATGAEQNAHFAGKTTGLEAKSFGIHWVFAPVMDVNTESLNPIINTRAFSDDPALAPKFGCAYLPGLQSAGPSACASTTPVTAPPRSTRTPPAHRRLRPACLREELLPFAAAIRAGVDSVMVGHIAMPASTPHSRFLSPPPSPTSAARMGFKGPSSPTRHDGRLPPSARSASPPPPARTCCSTRKIRWRR